MTMVAGFLLALAIVVALFYLCAVVALIVVDILDKVDRERGDD